MERHHCNGLWGIYKFPGQQLQDGIAPDTGRSALAETYAKFKINMARMALRIQTMMDIMMQFRPTRFDSGSCFR